MKKTINLRSLAAQTLERVVEQGQSLSNLLPAAQKNLSDKDSALLQEICFGVLRTLPLLETAIQQLMSRPLTGKQRTLHFLIMVGLYQLIYTRIPPHAALAETVEGAAVLKRQQLKGLINGVLRQFQRQQETLLPELEAGPQRFLHPAWLLKRLQLAWPEQWQHIVEANNQRPPMWLRVNRQHHTREQWLALLQESGNNATPHPLYPDALMLENPTAVGQLPGFDRGWVTVQDASAQGCVTYLEPQNGEYILDLCAAPGGKTTHILEAAPEASVMAVDVDAQRLKRVYENLQRLNMQADVKQGDGRFPQQWCDDVQFDRILLDAPCSATGVIRRHPDIKWLRRDRDIPELAALQREILDAVWPHLKPGGTLVYATCSVLPEENHIQIEQFLERHADAEHIPLSEGPYAGLQSFPHPQGGDGFFYAKLIKK
ncbi:MAG: 16S rRNA (cytosine(967)-C(5))-methyltransferase RsmB [Mixta calida]|jgi:16S rRNA (cytosine967-C5)-methyltransferase|uniref:Ribosomal RNA small subunit methyltransferase B n=2 Tax=Mixta calida TaxID=665913 RepID=A0ABM6RXT5_9GAMM|nr:MULTISPECIES: 16S rRNA (cytosine(967)-C(5))-methyltransferase RsmB [Mixta]AIX75697.1 16S rRNA methyltransferase [Pantoea sp. PSNIH2]MDU3818747.1 16S rRNA (cytosine(967)-C(5))-methyltransferase RsmB [Pantoea sp.]POU50541.1 16S rRNA (cytosine(967)-C(5))-methyltransferase RsmB [Pantoea sp. PSNIH5]POU58970.1 16S rRNA (cytosine(967)-C(5))-methyltransferase RsmB [Pantoea sp. PSNIH4]POY69091.1 16S rRNA (cytosine(967)-C(5))-methyltransferase RsmB [Pantoea sp. PSNIH3]